MFGYLHGSNACIKNLSVSGKVSAKSSVGGIVGRQQDGTVSNCYASCDVTGSSKDGGIVGDAQDTVKNCISTGSVSSTGNLAGGIAGFAWTKSNISNCKAAGAISGDKYVGGIAGYNQDIKCIIANCAFESGTISGNLNVGGVVGKNEYGTVTNCASNALAITATGDNPGGIAGVNSGDITNCGRVTDGAASAIGAGSGTTADILSYSVESADKAAVTCLVNKFAVDLKQGGEPANVRFTTFPGADTYAKDFISGTITASVVSEDIATATPGTALVEVKALNAGMTMMNVGYTFKSTYFNGDLTQTSGDCAVSMDVRITVTKASELKITPTEQSITVGGTVSLTASGASATDGVKWTTAGDIVTLDKTTGTTVTATGAKEGTVTVTATAEDGTTATALITVTAAGGGGNGGCSAGFGGMALLLLACAPLALKKGKSRGLK